MMDPGMFSLAWETYEKSICNGLRLLQQGGEFVDMTLAADGHHVKVHQMVMSLVSPFIKELITSVNCPHPVIFLNQISHKTLQCILEYAYTGVVVLSADMLTSFLQACHELHIKGLQDITIHGDGKNILQLIQANSAKTTPTESPKDPLKMCESVLFPIKRRRITKTYVPIKHTQSDDETHDDETHNNETTQNHETDDDVIQDDETTQNYETDNDVIQDDETHNDETYDNVTHNDETHDKELNIKRNFFGCSQNNGDEDKYEEIVPYREGSRWVSRNGYFYVVNRTKGQTAYLRCASDKCPANWKLRKTNGAGPVLDQHNHPPTPWVPNRNTMFQALKRRAMSENIPLTTIYEEEASRYKDAASHLTYESVSPSMRKWRGKAKLANSRTLQSTG